MDQKFKPILIEKVNLLKGIHPEYDWYAIKFQMPNEENYDLSIIRTTKGEIYETSSYEEIVYSSVQ